MCEQYYRKKPHFPTRLKGAMFGRVVHALSTGPVLKSNEARWAKGGQPDTPRRLKRAMFHPGRATTFETHGSVPTRLPTTRRSMAPPLDGLSTLRPRRRSPSQPSRGGRRVANPNPSDRKGRCSCGAVSALVRPFEMGNVRGALACWLKVVRWVAHPFPTAPFDHRGPAPWTRRGQPRQRVCH